MHIKNQHKTRNFPSYLQKKGGGNWVLQEQITDLPMKALIVKLPHCLELSYQYQTWHVLRFDYVDVVNLVSCAFFSLTIWLFVFNSIFLQLKIKLVWVNLKIVLFFANCSKSAIQNSKCLVWFYQFKIKKKKHFI